MISKGQGQNQLLSARSMANKPHFANGIPVLANTRPKILTIHPILAGKAATNHIANAWLVRVLVPIYFTFILPIFTFYATFSSCSFLEHPIYGNRFTYLRWKHLKIDMPP
ncbi:MAG: hypothetical protein ACI9IQ_002942 [Cyclobacteriaceae bacterium]|jgi:hypothetical protein